MRALEVLTASLGAMRARPTGAAVARGRVSSNKFDIVLGNESTLEADPMTETVEKFLIEYPPKSEEGAPESSIDEFDLRPFPALLKMAQAAGLIGAAASAAPTAPVGAITAFLKGLLGEAGRGSGGLAEMAAEADRLAADQATASPDMTTLKRARD